MKKIIGMCLAWMLAASVALAAEDIQGFWTTIDDETGAAKSVVRIYEHQGKYYGRVVELLQNKQAVAEKLPGKPPILGMDIIWDLEPAGARFKGGQILDPKKGKVYACEIWREGENLIVRGKIAFLGRNQTWLANKAFAGEAKSLIPQKPRL